MSDQHKEIFDDILARWIEEFGRAVEMFTGEKPELTPAQVAGSISDAEMTERTWWRQVTQGEKSFSIWAGAKEEVWKSLGEGDEAKSTFFEMLSQANQGTAAVLSAGFPVPLRFEDGVIEAPAPAVPTQLAHIKVVFRGTDAGAIFLLLEKSAFAILNPEEPESVPSAQRDTELLASMGASPAMLSRLLDLNLPVSVLLGRATITIKEALKLMPGSVVELDRQVGDYVEIIVHGTVVAKGEIVSVKGNYGVRIKEVISRQDRIALQEAA